MAESDTKTRGSGLLSKLPLDRLKSEAGNLLHAATESGAAKIGGRIDSLTGRLADAASGGGGESMAGKLVKNVAGATDPESTAGNVVKNMAEGDSPAKGGVKAVASKVTDSVKEFGRKLTGRGGGGKGQKLKVTNIVEQIDVPLPRKVAYAQWTKFEDFPSFMKKVENVSQDGDEKVNWKAQIFWSHRGWAAKIVDQVPNERIVWKSDGQKGHVDGAVTFHEVTPDLTRILIVLEYYPKGLFEHVGNIWRAPGRRARLEMKHFVRHASTQTILHQDEIEGWQGEIHDGHAVEESDRTDADDQDRAEGDDQDGAEGDDQDRAEGDDQDRAEGDDQERSQADGQDDAEGQGPTSRTRSGDQGRPKGSKPDGGKPNGGGSGGSADQGETGKRPSGQGQSGKRPEDRVRKPAGRQGNDTAGSPGAKPRPSAQRQDSGRQGEGQSKSPRPERRAGQPSS